MSFLPCHKSFETAKTSQLVWKGVPQGRRGCKECPVSCRPLGLVGQDHGLSLEDNDQKTARLASKRVFDEISWGEWVNNIFKLIDCKTVHSFAYI